MEPRYRASVLASRQIQPKPFNAQWLLYEPLDLKLKKQLHFTQWILVLRMILTINGDYLLKQTGCCHGDAVPLPRGRSESLYNI
jgi:hypothetical protein